MSPTTAEPALADGAVTVQLRGASRDIALITLNRPRKLNALSTHMEAALLDTLRSSDVTGSRAVIVTGTECAFSAGADTGELRDMTPQAIAAYYRGSGAVYEEFAALPQPTVAAISGYCMGGGLELALAADFRVAAPDAVFALPEIGLGILPGSGGIARLVREVGPARTRDLVLRGRRFDSQEAYAWGLLTEIAEDSEAVTERALTLAAKLTAHTPLALALAKRVVDAAADAPKETALLLEHLAYAALNRTG
ncbi:enoyl-CoA hydratase/isomerase family protein [Streptomyces cavernicola]|uniref:Enoyl-CoA hydratase/isomerase family protein n=1 Tax=Streptomyces cavernicola TaxID=3043613 RepID=A0ABT6S596_9ACTN|nr:enoyl-CoA hydratase/isomerase family protein [Streptomyces sp. B-S-A6]MDI3403265.1 enoyl-CoA hydratase/isomerase family protein [Streptomyces sp. B-S-A6]